MQPLSPNIKEWIKANPKVKDALKGSHPERFLALGAVVISFPLGSNDKVIGVYTYDYMTKTPKFKQDFIVDIDGKELKYILYTRNPGGSSQDIKDINEFFNKYGKNGNYANSHWPKFDELPNEVKPNAIRTISLAEKIKKLGGYKLPSQEIIQKIQKEIMKMSDGEKYTNIKLIPKKKS